MKDLRKRVFTALLFGMVVIGSIWLGALSFSVLVFFISLLALFEFYRMHADDMIQAQVFSGVFTSQLVFVLLLLVWHQVFSPQVLYLAAPLFFVVFIIELFRKKSRPFLNIAVTITGFIYITLPLILFSAIAFKGNETSGFNGGLILGILSLLWVYDSGAYFIGSRFGRTRILERISPKKSWEGFSGGMVAAVLAARIISKIVTTITLTDWIIVALIISVFGTLGDFVESMLKRSHNVKDSGNLLPGHGGLLDRFDGLFGSAPFVFFYLFFFNRI